MSNLKVLKEGILLPVKVIPRAAKNAIVGWENEELKVRLNAVPEKGEANEALIAFLAKSWKLPKSSFSIHSGETSRHKKLLIQGVTLDHLKQILYTAPA
jgi:uncharacterized protein (TIGR00251 family)